MFVTGASSFGLSSNYYSSSLTHLLTCVLNELHDHNQHAIDSFSYIIKSYARHLCSRLVKYAAFIALHQFFFLRRVLKFVNLLTSPCVDIV